MKFSCEIHVNTDVQSFIRQLTDAYLKIAQILVYMWKTEVYFLQKGTSVLKTENNILSIEKQLALHQCHQGKLKGRLCSAFFVFSSLKFVYCILINSSVRCYHGRIYQLCSFSCLFTHSLDFYAVPFF